MKKNKGITLISLIITIVILIILAGIAITLGLGKNGIFTRAKEAKELTNSQSATEELNIKITAIKIDKYAEKQQMPTLRELAEELKKDEDIEYITEKSKIAEVEYNVPSENPTVIYTKLKKYQYEFEINSELEINRINGKEIEQTGSSSSSSIQTSVGDFEITTPYIGTSSVTVKINKETINEEISKYVYIIGNIVKEETKEEITIEELTEDTQINIMVIAITTTTNKHLVARKTVKTEPRTYLYNNGDQCNDFTGGWRVLTPEDSSYITSNLPTLKFDENKKCMNIVMPAKKSVSQHGAITINNNIKFSDYKKIYVIFTATLGNYNKTDAIKLCKNKKNLSDGDDEISRMAYTAPVNQKTKKFAGLSDVEDIYFYFQTYTNTPINCDIYEVWLEK